MGLGWLRRPRIAVTELHGIIGNRPRTAEQVRIFESLRKDGGVRAVVLDIDSPGGSVVASDRLFLAVNKLAAEKPIVAYIGGAGTSGAYLVGCAATRIVSLPSAIIGSIGVISYRPIIHQLMERLGVRMNVTKSGPLKDMGAFYREPTEEEAEKEQALIDEFFDDFVNRVASARNLDDETARRYATGEVFTARKAKDMNLVDELGDLDTAIDLATQLGEVPRRITYARPRRSLRERLVGGWMSALAKEIAAEAEDHLVRRIHYLK
jgi:protease-4